MSLGGSLRGSRGPPDASARTPCVGVEIRPQNAPLRSLPAPSQRPFRRPSQSHFPPRAVGALPLIVFPLEAPTSGGCFIDKGRLSLPTRGLLWVPQALHKQPFSHAQGEPHLAVLTQLLTCVALMLRTAMSRQCQAIKRPRCCLT